MANFFVIYDLSGSKPTHKEIDSHISRAAVHYGRVLDTVWYVGVSDQTPAQLRSYLANIIGKDDRLLVVECRDAAWQNLMIHGESFKKSWTVHAKLPF
jgi:hypothetical protein